MRWLNEQIKQDSATQSECLLRRFVNLMHMSNYTEVEPFTLAQVDEVFNAWLEKDAIQNPTYRRRYLITQQDLHRLFTEEKKCFQNSRASSLSDHQPRLRENNAPTLPRSQISNTLGIEKEDTRLLQAAGHDTPMNIAQQSGFPANDEAVEIGKLGGPDKPTHTRNYLPRQPADIHSQGSNVEDVIMTREVTIDSSPDTEMSQSSITTTYRGRKPKLPSDTPKSSVLRKLYICKRCNESGHAIQNCPTNLDPRYDRAPARDYQCKFCGQHGNHYATLCPKNHHEGSLTKQRKRAKMKNREPRTPSQSGRRHYRDRETSAIPSENRYRSRSPRRRSRDHYRTRSLERRHPYQRGADSYSSRTSNEYDRHWPPPSGELDVSPYTTRARLTRGPHMNLGITKGGGAPSRSGDDPFRPEHQHHPPSTLHYIRSPPLRRTWHEHKDLDKVTTRDEGRLAYDDKIDGLGEPKSSPCPSVTDPPRYAVSIGEEEATESAISPVMSPAMGLPKGLDKTQDEIEDFLCALAADIMLQREYNPRPVRLNSRDAKVEVGCGLSRDICTDDSSRSDITTEPESPAAETTPSPKKRLVECPPFSPEVVSLFNARDNPIINVKAKRNTADKLMEKSEYCWTHRSRQAHEGIATHQLLPCRLR
ncbi:hypothetical protein F5Y09DRAFT_329521 [Xylaria sp. FL1042]|nr:hypothetical protein F5Y09DRAFT_329521 [Xylaria sp. FL1042]